MNDAEITSLKSAINRLRQANKEKGIEHTEYECSKCKDTGILFVKDEDGNVVARDCECMSKRMFERRIAVSGISASDLKKGFSDFNTFDEKTLIIAKQISMGYVKSFNDIKDTRANSLLLMGAAGRGKTMLGLAVTNNLIHGGVPVIYMAYREVITQLKQIMVRKERGDTDEVSYNREMEKYKNISVLFIDDLFKGKITEADLNIIYEIVNHRYLKNLPVIVSTEKTRQELIDIDEAIGSRLIEMSKGHIVEFTKDTQNYRLR